MTIFSSKSARANEPKFDYAKNKARPYKNKYLTLEMFQALGTSKLAKVGLLSPDGIEVMLSYNDKEKKAIETLSKDEKLALPVDWDSQAPLSVERITWLANEMGKEKSSNPKHLEDASRARTFWEGLIKMHQDAAKTVDGMGLHGSKLYYSLMLKAEFLSEMLEFAINKAQAISSNSGIANMDKASLAEQKKNLLAAYGQVAGKDYAQKVAGIAGTVFALGATFFTQVKTELIDYFSKMSELPNTLYMAAAGAVSVVIGFAAYYGIDIMKALKQNRVTREFDKKINHRTYQEVSINRLHVALVHVKAIQLMAEYGMFDELSRKTTGKYFALAYKGDFESIKEVHNELERRINYKIKGHLGETGFMTYVRNWWHSRTSKGHSFVPGMTKDSITLARMSDGAVDVDSSVPSDGNTGQS